MVRSNNHIYFFDEFSHFIESVSDLLHSCFSFCGDSESLQSTAFPPRLSELQSSCFSSCRDSVLLLSTDFIFFVRLFVSLSSRFLFCEELELLFSYIFFCGDSEL